MLCHAYFLTVQSICWEMLGDDTQQLQRGSIREISKRQQISLCFLMVTLFRLLLSITFLFISRAYLVQMDWYRRFIDIHKKKDGTLVDATTAEKIVHLQFQYFSQKYYIYIIILPIHFLSKAQLRKLETQFTIESHQAGPNDIMAKSVQIGQTGQGTRNGI